MAENKVYFYLFIVTILISSISVIYATPEQQVDVLIRLDGSGLFSKSDADDNYVTSDYLPDTLIGLVHVSGDFTSVVTGSNSMALQNKIGSKTYLVYTKGDRYDINSKIKQLQSGDFEKMPNPSFGFPISKKHTISIELYYEHIDLFSKETFSTGFNDLIIKNLGKFGDQTIIDVKSN
ncbi:MAG: hypothetical protein K0B07_04405 [DPANN group archaeon]|nr:hypothetical protein [DPANN group archaeon]